MSLLVQGLRSIKFVSKTWILASLRRSQNEVTQCPGSFVY